LHHDLHKPTLENGLLREVMAWEGVRGRSGRGKGKRPTLKPPGESDQERLKHNLGTPYEANLLLREVVKEMMMTAWVLVWNC